MAQKASSTSLRIGFFDLWKSHWFGDIEYNQLLAQDYKVRIFLEEIFISSQLPTSELILKRKVGNRMFVHVNVFVPADKRNQFLFFKRFFFFLTSYRQSFLFYFRKMVYFFESFRPKLMRFYRKSIWSWKQKQICFFNYSYILFLCRYTRLLDSMINYYLTSTFICYYPISSFSFSKLYFFKYFLFRRSSPLFHYFYLCSIFTSQFISFYSSFGINKKLLAARSKLNLLTTPVVKPLQDQQHFFTRNDLVFSVSDSVSPTSFNRDKNQLVARHFNFKLLVAVRHWFKFYKRIISVIKLYVYWCSFKEKAMLRRWLMRHFIVPFLKITSKIKEMILSGLVMRLRHACISLYSSLGLQGMSPLYATFFIINNMTVFSPCVIGFLSYFISLSKREMNDREFSRQIFSFAKCLSNFCLISNSLRLDYYGLYLVSKWVSQYFRPYLSFSNSFITRRKELAQIELLSRTRYFKTQLLYRSMHQFVLVIESLLSKYIGGKFFLFPRFFIRKLPRLTSAKLIALYIKYELEKGVPFFEVMQFVRKWCSRAIFKQYKKKMEVLFPREQRAGYKRLKREVYAQSRKNGFGRHLSAFKNFRKKKLVFKFGKRFRSALDSICYLRGVRMSFSGRINKRNMMARTEWYRKGPVPTQLLSAQIDYYSCAAQTKLGSVGIKVWLHLVQRRDFI